MSIDLELRTGRLILRPWRKSDLAPFAALNADPRVMEHFPKVLTRDESDAIAARVMETIDQRGFGLWAAEVINGPQFIGFVGLSVPRFQAHFTPCIEIGWRLAYDHWGRGYATEAAAAVVGDAFRRLNFDEVVSFTAVANVRSRRVMGKLGMTQSPIDDFEHPLIPEGHPLRRHVLYRLSRSSWEQATTFAR